MAANKTAHEAIMPKPLLNQSMKRANLSKTVKTSLHSKEKGHWIAPGANVIFATTRDINNAQAISSPFRLGHQVIS
jgi:hypothetical protein